MRARFILVDAALVGLGGHYLDYAKDTLDAAALRGFDTVLVTQRSIDPVGLAGHRVIRGLSQSYWQNFFAAGDAGQSFFDDTKRFASKALGDVFGERWRDGTLRLLVWGAMAALTPYGMFLAASERFTTLHFNRAAKTLCADLVHLTSELGGSHAGDLIFFPSASAVELLAVARLVRTRATSDIGFALLFRRDPDYENAANHGVLARRRRRLAMAARRLSSEAPVRLFSDTCPLARRYGDIMGKLVQLAPIPVQAVPTKARDHHGEVVVVTYLGDARREKGFHLLPEIARASPPNVRFRVQSNVSGPGEPECLEGMLTLQANPAVELLAGPFSTEEYRSLIAAADVVLLPYEPDAYRSRSSGVFVEALANGVPVIVPSGTWMADELTACESEVGLIADAEPEALAQSINEFVVKSVDLKVAATILSRSWGPSHSGAALVDVLCNAFPSEPHRLSEILEVGENEDGCGQEAISLHRRPEPEGLHRSPLRI